MSRPVRAIALIAILFPLAQAATAATWYVSCETGDDLYNGNSPGRPFRTIGRALQAAANSNGHDVIFVAGTDVFPSCAAPNCIYTENLTVLTDPTGAGVEILGGFDSTFLSLPGTTCSIIDGGALSSVITVGGDQAPVNDFRIEGFVIRNGNATASPPPQRGGGGILFLNSAGTVHGNVIRDNVVSVPDFAGGGIAAYLHDPLPTAPLEITNNTIEGNRVADGDGGGLAVYYYLPTLSIPADFVPRIEGNTITANRATSNGVARSFGGGIFLQGLGGLVSGNTVTSNVAEVLQPLAGCAGGDRTESWNGNGGGMAILTSNATVTNNTISANEARVAAGPAVPCYLNACGAGVYARGFRGTFDSNLVSDNVATGATGLPPADVVAQAIGAGLNVTFGFPSSVVSNNTVLGNRCLGEGRFSGAGAGVYLYAFGGELKDNTIGGTGGGEPNTTFGFGGGLGLANFPPRPGDPIARTSRLTNNVIRGNQAYNWAGAFVYDKTGGAVLRENLFTQNLSDLGALRPTGGIALNGFPTVENNLVTENTGHGIYVFGRSTQYAEATLSNVTVSGNTGTAFFTRYASGTVLRDSILWDNMGGSFDDVLHPGSVDPDVVFLHNVSQGVAAPGTGNQSADPLFVAGPGGPYYLSQITSSQGSNSPAWERGSRRVADANLTGLSTRTDGVPDYCLVDIGFHYPGTPAPDGDADTIPDGDEPAFGLSPTDQDSDDDGLMDGIDCIRDVDGDTLINALDCDSDNDGIHDGTEYGLYTPLPDTVLSNICFDGKPSWIPDADLGITTTDFENPDSDGGGEPDGEEDSDQDGDPTEAGETDPSDNRDDDTDLDTVGNLVEDDQGTDRLDRDTDDDGILDPAEGWTDTDGDTFVDKATDRDLDGLPNANDPDSDSDKVPDSVEAGWNRTLNPPLDPHTDTSSPNFRDDADPATVTNPYFEDTDGGGCPDGSEDANLDGRLDAGETDPRLAGDDGNCSVPFEVPLLLVRRDPVNRQFLYFEIPVPPPAGHFYRLYRGNLATLAVGAYDHRVEVGVDGLEDTGDDRGDCRMGRTTPYGANTGSRRNVDEDPLVSPEANYYLVSEINDLAEESILGYQDLDGNGVDPARDASIPRGFAINCP